MKPKSNKPGLVVHSSNVGVQKFRLSKLAVGLFLLRAKLAAQLICQVMCNKSLNLWTSVDHAWNEDKDAYISRVIWMLNETDNVRILGARCMTLEKLHFMYVSISSNKPCHCNLNDSYMSHVTSTRKHQALIEKLFILLDLGCFQPGQRSFFPQLSAVNKEMDNSSQSSLPEAPTGPPCCHAAQAGKRHHP